MVKLSVFSVFLFVFSLSYAGAEEPTYVGIGKCMMCHLPHFESWSTTRMSRAFDLLKPGVREEAKIKAGFDPKEDFTRQEYCLECHVTGYGKPGGFTSIEETPDMVGVQCEMCHGPGSIYSKMMLRKRGTYKREDYMKQGGLTMASKENNICVKKCHNDMSPFAKEGQEFDFENRKAIGTHNHNLKYIYLPFDL